MLRIFVTKLISSALLCAALTGISYAKEQEFCNLEGHPVLTEQQQDKLFLEAMFEADYVFRGRLFTFYDERCDGEVCAFKGLVFKVLEEIDNWLNPYEETSWVEDCQRIWLHPQQWREDEDTWLFKVNKEYLLLGRDTPRGMVIFGSRGGAKVKELQMQYELERIGRK